MSINAVKSKNFTLMEIQRSLNLPFVPDQYSTLNEKFNVGNVNPPSDGYPTIGYIGIGRGGKTNVIGSGNNTLVDMLQHNVTDGAFFEQIPFVMVPTTADLQPTERSRFRLRILETIGGVDYYSYYLMVLPTTGISVDRRIITITNGAQTSDLAYIPSAINLSPTPVDISNTTVNVTNGSHFVTQAILPVNFNTVDINNIIDACITKYGDIRYATISEVGMVSGFDVTVTTTLGGNSAVYTDLQCAQVMAYAATSQELQVYPSSLTLQFSLANSSPYVAT